MTTRQSSQSFFTHRVTFSDSISQFNDDLLDHIPLSEDVNDISEKIETQHPFDIVREKFLPYLKDSEASFPSGYSNSPSIGETFTSQQSRVGYFSIKLMTFEIPKDITECSNFYITLNKLHEGLSIGITYRCFSDPDAIRDQCRYLQEHARFCSLYLTENKISIPIY